MARSSLEVGQQGLEELMVLRAVAFLIYDQSRTTDADVALRAANSSMQPTIDTDDARFRVHRLRRLANLFDNAIRLPGGFRIGLDPLIGLIPGIGDAVGAIVAAFILTEAANIGVPRSILLRMMGNVLIDGLVGSIPLLGDLFDFAFKANSRNIDLLERYHFDPKGTQQSSRLFLTGAALISALVLIAIPALIVFIVLQIVELF